MARHRQSLDAQAAQIQAFTIGDQMVKLAAIDRKVRLQVEDAFEDFLHRRDVGANGRFATQAGFQVGGSAQVVGVGVGFQNPSHLQAMAKHIVHHFVCGGRAGAARLGVVVEHRIDDGAGIALLGMNHIGHRPGARVKNAVNHGLDRCWVGLVHENRPCECVELARTGPQYIRKR